MRKNKYEVLDQVLINAILGGKELFGQLVRLPEISAEALRACRNPDDVLNGRLQALRKAEKIFCEKGVWCVMMQFDRNDLIVTKPGEDIVETVRAARAQSE